MIQTYEPNFGRCPCSGVYQTRYVEVRFANGKLYSGIPQGACPQCGSRVYKAHVLDRIEALFRLSKAGGNS